MVGRVMVVTFRLIFHLVLRALCTTGVSVAIHGKSS